MRDSRSPGRAPSFPALLLRAGLALLPAAGALPASPVVAQEADARGPAAPSDADVDLATGTYRLEDGRLLIVWDVADQMPGGRHRLAAFEPESGWLRTLRPASAARFRFGPGWFAPEPTEGTLEIVAGGDSLVWRRPAGVRAGARVPLRRRDVTFESGDVELAGELVLPPEGVGAPPYPALVMIPCYGPLTRRTPRIVADQYAAAGIAALIHDKRGTGASSGTWVPGAVPDFARDAAAALALLRTRPEVDGARVGVMASSLGGLVAPLLHERDPDWAFFVCRVCPTVPLWEQKLETIVRQGREAGLAAGEILDALARKVLAARYALSREDYGALESVEESTAGEAWRDRVGSPEDWRRLWPQGSPSWDGYRRVLAIDPSELYRTLEAPALVILGERDDRLPGDYHAARARRAFERGGRQEHEVWVLPGASHGLMEVERGDDGERLPFRRFVPGWHGRMVQWVAGRVGIE